MTEYDPEVWHDQAVSLLRLMSKRKWDIFLMQLESCQRTGMLPVEGVLRLQALADKGGLPPVGLYLGAAGLVSLLALLPLRRDSL